jgi:thiamine-monophosphate kinase
MGAHPRLFFLTLAIPPRQTGAWLNGFLRGMARAARQLNMLLAGGDTSRFSSIAMAITVLGKAPRGQAVRRSSARPGDILCVSGRLGRAQLGLELLRKLPRASLRSGLQSRGALRRLLQPHLYPAIRVQLGAWLARHRMASGMMDVSDGLSTDLPRLCAASGVGARLWAERIPRVRIPAEGFQGLKSARLDPLELALHGGEDYELLFAVPPRRVKELRRAPGFSELAAIGEIERGSRVVIVDAGGRAKPLCPGGWDSFRKG